MCNCVRERHMCTIPSLGHMSQSMRTRLIVTCWNWGPGLEIWQFCIGKELQVMVRQEYLRFCSLLLHNQHHGLALPRLFIKIWFWIYFASCLCFLSPCLIALFGDLCWEATHLEQCWTSLSFHERKLSGQSWPSFFFPISSIFVMLVCMLSFSVLQLQNKSYIFQVIYYWSCVLICYTRIVFLMSCNDFTSEIQYANVAFCSVIWLRGECGLPITIAIILARVF